MRAEDGRDPAGAAADGVAVNAADSQSGWGALADAGLGGPAVVTGSHAASMDAVAGGAAALAAIDVVSWDLGPHPALTVRATTPPTPATPFVTGRADLAAPLHDALAEAIAAMAPEDRAAIRLAGILRLPDGAYDAPVPPPPVPREP